jgi:hypothetical protein
MTRFKILCGATLLLVLVILGVTWFSNAATAVSVKPRLHPPRQHIRFKSLERMFLEILPSSHRHTRMRQGHTFHRTM